MTPKDSKREILGMTTTTSKFQVTISKKLRDKHDLKEIVLLSLRTVKKYTWLEVTRSDF